MAKPYEIASGIVTWVCLRFRQLTNEINRIKADIICLQEVSDSQKHHIFSKLCGYDYSHWQSQTGLSILSRHPIDKTDDFEYGTSLTYNWRTKH